MSENPCWPGGNPGGDVPIVDAADLESVSNLYRDVASRATTRQSESNPAIGIELLKQVCSLGADVPAVAYRYMMLQLLGHVSGLEEAPWRRLGQLNQSVLKVAARIPMKWMEVGSPQRGLPFDVDSFFLEVDKESAE
jgi:hypothetical protein